MMIAVPSVLSCNVTWPSQDGSSYIFGYLEKNKRLCVWYTRNILDMHVTHFMIKRFKILGKYHNVLWKYQRRKAEFLSRWAGYRSSLSSEDMLIVTAPGHQMIRDVTWLSRDQGDAWHCLYMITVRALKIHFV